MWCIYLILNYIFAQTVADELHIGGNFLIYFLTFFLLTIEILFFYTISLLQKSKGIFPIGGTGGWRGGN